MLFHIVIFAGFDELDAIAPFEVLHNAAVSGADARVALVTADGAEMVTAAHGLTVRASGRLGEGERPDVVIVAGGGWNSRAPQGVRAEVTSGIIPAALARLHAEGVTVATVCTGAMLAASAGLTAGRPATTHHGAIADLRASGAEIIEARVVDDSDLISAGGVTSGLDLALWLVERYFGAEIERLVEATMEYERRGPVWRRGA
ncbi:MAG TPA: DJ-1/PfpI family protein [Ktedonobacterales bacterium]|nr:DJ-1/PfpI family protein [Ktedonobacterales bacterium]